jgi:glycyl-tRNA synthetase
MFASEIGPTGQLKGFLRPETAQGIFLNFRRLIEFNNGKMPFAGAQIGIGFRNEIRPQQGLLRVREFQMAEIEHFVDPLDKSHHKFANVSEDLLPLFTAANQEGDGSMVNDMSMATAVESGTVGNQTLGYFMARTYRFLKDCGINAEAIRFRQHRSNEMAHYAQDCWDAEVETSYGWIEVAGHSDRSCFDLQRHAEKTKVELVAARLLKDPKTIKFIQVTVDK